MDRRKLGALAGIAAPVIFVGVFLIEGALRPGYDPVNRFVSELSLGPRGWIQITSFIITGILYIVFAWGLAAHFTSGKASRFGPLVFAIIGLGYLISGPAVMDSTSVPVDQLSISGLLHAITGAFVFLFMPISAIIFFRRFRTDPDWTSFAVPTLLAFVIMVIAVLLLRLAGLPVGRTLTPWDGWIQRAVLIPFHTWVFLFAWRLKKISAK